MKKLPIGIQDFEKIRTGGYYYVDKTEYVWRMVSEGGGYYFLSRPRRFGKSLFISTLQCAFEGRRELFEGLYIYDKWDWSVKYPVIHISFGECYLTRPEDLEETLFSIINEEGERFGIELKERLLHRRFMELIKKIKARYGKVVLLVDEYDKPILDNILNEDVSVEMRDILKNFYSVIKDADPYLKFVFLTGVSKFSKVSLFSGLNNLNDITIDREYAEICGYTQSEFEEVFSDAIQRAFAVMKERGICSSREDFLEKVKNWYNGYSWLGERVYNPFDILLLLQKKEFRPYWFESGTPEFLVRMILERGYYLPKLECLRAGEEILGSFDVGRIRPETLLFQTGYLTIVSMKEDEMGFREYILSYPNYEVKSALMNYILSELEVEEELRLKARSELKDIMAKGDIDGMRELFYRFFSSVPYHWYRGVQRYEGYWASIFYAYFVSAGFDVRAEDTTSQGRIDLTVLHKNKVFIFEFKVGSGGGSRALGQIKQKRYWEKYSADEIYIIGIEFDPESRNIARFEWEKIR